MNIANYYLDLKQNLGKYIIAFFKWSLLGIAIGILCGIIGTAFAKSVSFVTELRGANGWLIFLLPAGGLISVAVYKLLKVNNKGTDDVFKSVRTDSKLSILLAPAVFIGSVITHLFGGSAGREGAALQLGGSISSGICRLFKLDDKSRHILTLSGMGALFSALFGTPLGACIFALEVVSVGYICSAAFFPSIIASITAYAVSSRLGVEPEKFAIKSMPDFNIESVLKVVLVALIGSIVSIVFCFIMHSTHKIFAKYIRNDFLRIFTGGLIIVIFTLIVGNNEYNGSGMEIIHRIFSGQSVKPYAFMIKILFTAVTIAVGFKGGEIIPSMFIGATLGYSSAVLIGLDPMLGAAAGMASLFCGATNCPIATIILFTEMFGSEGMIFFALSAVISFFISGYSSLYSEQKIIFSKITEEML